MSSKKPISSERRDGDRAAPFVYRPAPGWTPPGEDSAGGGIAVLTTATRGPDEAPSPNAEEQAGVREKEAFEQGFREGVAKAGVENEAQAQKQRAAVAEAIRAFTQQRDEYFRRVESEVVTLALAIARKILRREAQIDPLLLTGIVRVALEKIAGSQNVRLRVHPSQVARWREFIAQQNNFSVAPELSGDAELDTEQCRIETELGVTELSLETELKEVEQGLLDLLAQKPSAK